MVEQLAFNPIAEGVLLKRNDTNKKHFASILFNFFRDALCGRFCLPFHKWNG